MENPADYYYGVLWNKLYRRSLVEAHGIRMDAKLSWCEDFLFNLEYVRYATTFYALRTAGLLLCEDEGFAGESEDQLRADGGDETRDVRVLQRLLQGMCWMRMRMSGSGCRSIIF